MAGSYEKIKLLGQGGFGKVYLVRKKENPKLLYAMKEMSIDKQSVGQIYQEVKLLCELDHQYILSLKGGFVKDYSVYIITEYCPNGDLQDFINSRKRQQMEQSLVLQWSLQIASAVKYLHGEKVIHRDLKLANIFLDSKNNCKLGDFGISRVLDCTLDMARTQAGTPCYMSPELINGKPYNDKTDIWSLAIVMYELATLQKAFNPVSLRDLYNQITDGPIPAMPKNYSAAFRNLLSSMMERNPGNRPSASHIVNTLKRPVTPAAKGKHHDAIQAIDQLIQRLDQSPLPSTPQNKVKQPAKQKPLYQSRIQQQIQVFAPASPMQQLQMQPLMQPYIQTPLQLQPQAMVPQMQPYMQPMVQSPFQLQAIPQQPLLQQQMMPQMMPQMQPWVQQPMQPQAASPQMQLLMYPGMYM